MATKIIIQSKEYLAELAKINAENKYPVGRLERLHAYRPVISEEAPSDLEKPDEDDEEYVDLIASGYQWTCPSEDCGTLNNEIEVTETVTCSVCGRVYNTNPPEHAQG